MKKIVRGLVCALAVVLAVTAIPVTAEAATLKLNKKSITLAVGEMYL